MASGPELSLTKGMEPTPTAALLPVLSHSETMQIEENGKGELMASLTVCPFQDND